MDYKDSKIIFNKKEIRWGNHDIMHIKEKEFIQKQAKDIMKLKPKSILELGYGLGLTAEIFKDSPKHLIVEIHPEIAQAAREAGYVVWEGDAKDFRSDEVWDVVYDDLYRIEPVDIEDKIKYNKYIKFEICR